MIVALVVSHDGARWLPQVISGLQSQQVAPNRIICVDTGSKDNSSALLAAAFGQAAIIAAPSSTSFPAAVAQGVEAAHNADWIWILHDDSTPDPGALAALLAHLETDPEAAILGPKLREWPSLRRLLEVGVSMSGTGRRETGLERGEYDQGQHDQVRDVLAVHSAGMLIRRSVLIELGGFDAQLPIFGNDLDLGWRAAQAGFRTVVVPSAIVFHAEAAHRGVRRTPLTGRHTHYAERRAALFTLLSNVPAKALPFQAVRILFGSILRVIGFLCIRAAGQALDELAAVISLYAHPGQLRRARAERRQLTGNAEVVRRLLPPWWVPYRHGLDFVTDLATAATQQAQDVAERRRLAKLSPATAHLDEAGKPKDRRRRYVETELSDDEMPEEEPGYLARFFSSPIALGVTAFLLLSGWGLRAGLTGGFTDGAGALSPTPGRTADWWRLYWEGWHPLLQGTPIPAPPYVLPFALASAILPGGPSWVVGAVLMLGVPIGFWGAWRLLRVAGHLLDERGMPRGLIALGAAAYSLISVTGGAWSDGRFGLVVSMAVLPWFAHAALGFAEPSAYRRWRAGWRSGLLLTVMVCFTPAIWVVAVLVASVIVGLALFLAPRSVGTRSAWGPPVVAMVLPWVLLVPWWIPLLIMEASPGLLLDAGQVPPEMLAGDLFAGVALATGQVSQVGGPWWLGAIAPALALVALIPRATRLPVLICWILAGAGTLVAVGLGRVQLSLPTFETTAQIAVIALFLQAVAIVAVCLAAAGLLRSAAPSLAHRAGSVLAVAALLLPAGGLFWTVTQASAAIPPGDAAEIPAYMTQSSLVSPAHGVLVVRGSVAVGLSYVVRRGDGMTVGEDEVVSLTPVDDGLTQLVREVASAPTPAAVAALANQGIEYVVLTAPADSAVSARLDAVGGLTPVSSEDRQTRAWQVDTEPAAGAIDGKGPTYRVALLAGQVVALLVALVMCGPGQRTGQRTGREEHREARGTEDV